MKDFCISFYYFNYDGGSPEPFRDNLGKGAFSDWRHFAWAVLLSLSVFFVINFLKENRK